MMTTTAERDSELADLRAAVKDIATDLGGPASLRASVSKAARFDEAAWRLIGQEMGLAGLGLDDEIGGAGGGLAELAVVAEEVGRGLLSVPFFSSTVLAGQLLARVPIPPRELIEAIAGGETLVGFAGWSADGAWNPDAVTVSAAEAGDGVTLSGPAGRVLDGADAVQLIVAATGPAGVDLYLVDPASNGVTVIALETLDLSRSQASVTLDGATGQPLTSGGAGAEILATVADVAAVVLAAEQVGGMQACLDLSVDYAKLRHQFSRPIGSFQAIKHRLADMLLTVEMGRSALDRALVVADDPEKFREAAALAQVWCSEGYCAVTAETVQVHGGIGFTWEHDAHLYFRRSRADAALLGDSTFHRERLAQLLAW